jgi:transposase InsO family protein
MGDAPQTAHGRVELRDGLLSGEIFTTLKEAQILIQAWRRHYNTVGTHSALGYRPPAPEAFAPPAFCNARTKEMAPNPIPN